MEHRIDRNVPAYTLLADLAVPVEPVHRANELVIVHGHHRRQPPIVKLVEDRRTELVIDVVQVDDVRIECVEGFAKEGPGPLVSHLVTKLGHRLPVPVTVVPGGMSMERIDAVC